jgi:hypothetical protein
MTIPGSASPLLLRTAAAAGGYAIERSLRFNSSDSAYLSRTPASAGNRKTWTWAGWVKRSTASNYDNLFATASSNNSLMFNGADQNSAIHFYDFNGSSFDFNLITSQVFRDFSAWYHIVVAIDTTQATAANRIKLYVNGSQVTAFATSTYPSLDFQTNWNTTGVHAIGRWESGASRYLSGYLADIHFIDGQALTPTSFGEFDDNGIWQPKAYTGTYGTNGFRLDFSDNSAATATTLGKDRAGSNNWTPNNLSVTAGAGNDSLVDVPTNGAQTDTGVGGEVRGNYATFNPLNNPATSATLGNGNLEVTANTSAFQAVTGTGFASSGKWYAEFTQEVTADDQVVGIAANTFVPSSAGNRYVGRTADSYAMYSDGRKINNNTFTSYGNSWATGDVIGVAFDLDNGKVWFSKNGTWQASGDPAAGTNAAFTGISGSYTFACSPYGTGKFIFNAGARPFAYTAPSGFKALNTASLPAPLVTKPSDVMDVALYTGNNTARSITGLGFSPDFVWIKGRSGATDHALYDIVRGVEKDLVSNSTAAETTQSTGLTAFNSDGFSIDTLAKLNTNAATYAAWSWDAGSSTVTNTQGSISSQVRANASAGFSVVTGARDSGSGAITAGHGLGVAPSFVIFKNRSISDSWYTWHSLLGSAESGYYLILNSTSAVNTISGIWGGTGVGMTSTTIGLSRSGLFNADGQTFVAYCFAPVAGYSSFGSFVGNGSNDGPMLYLGFRPRWFLYKDATASNAWVLFDSARSTYNVTSDYLFPNAADAEASFGVIDFLSNGVKIRFSGGSLNVSSRTYIYAAFAEHPFQYARAR